MKKSSFLKMICIVFIFCVMTVVASLAQTFTSLASFDLTNGENPEYVSLVQGLDGNFYGTTAFGGAGGTNGEGTVFKITPAGTLTTLYSFCIQADCLDGEEPEAGLILASNGNFYGTTYGGGAYGYGTVFKITAAGALTTLYSFCAGCADGSLPYAALVQGTDGNFYGTTFAAGANCRNNRNSGCGTVFKITPAGTLTTLYSFCTQANCADGSGPYGALVQGTDGNFYGTTNAGGANYGGTVFSITAGGTLTTLNSFNDVDGCSPYDGLVQAANGDFYGTTYACGANNGGTVFSITAGGTLTTLNSFGIPDGGYPYAGLVQAANGDFYGTTSYTVFKITPAGTVTRLHHFDLTDGGFPTGGLVQATNGTFYGTTTHGGSSSNCGDGCGTVFSLSVGLGPFVKTNPTSSKVGAKVIILGNNLKGTTGRCLRSLLPQSRPVFQPARPPEGSQSQHQAAHSTATWPFGFCRNHLALELRASRPMSFASPLSASMRRRYAKVGIESPV
jgi:uncharacterized repeat protein (TIGR03803 family)